MREASMLSMDPWQASETPDKSVLARAEVHSGVDPFECVFVCVCVCVVFLHVLLKPCLWITICVCAVYVPVGFLLCLARIQ